MKIRINKKAIWQYFLIYFLIIVNQSCLYEYFMNSNLVRYTICAVLFLVLLGKYKKYYNKYILFFAFLLVCVTITRLMNGGIGIGSWIGYMIPILICIAAIDVDKIRFLQRFVNVSTFLATIGLILFFIQITKPELLKVVLPTNTTLMDYKVWSDGYNYKTMYYPGYGLFLYTFRDGGDALLRNKGLFTESGICQMLYNAAIFILLFLNNRLNIEKKKLIRYLFILIIAVLTVQSSTGILILGVMLLAYMFLVRNKYQSLNLKNQVFFVVCIGVLLLMIDFSIRGNDSLIYVGLIQKFVGNNHKYQLHGNGQVRLGAAALSLKIMSENIFGVGADKLIDLQWMYDVAGGGAGIFTFGASIGMIPFLAALFFYIYPIVKKRDNIVTCMALLFFIFFSLLAQSNPFYSLLVMFPIYYNEVENRIF